MDKIKEIRRFFLLQVNDALFPIGGYSHSQGLETYIQQGIVHDEKTAADYIRRKLKLNLACTDLLGVRLAYESALKENVAELDDLEEILGASRIPMEQREASRKMGLLRVWGFLCSNGNRRRRNLVSLSLCPDLCNGDKLCKNHSAESECRAEASLRML